MKVINARNVSDALILGLQSIAEHGKRRDSRNGPVRVFDTPVATCYENPRERVILHPERDCNPFFHFMEALWMLGGRNDVEFISRYSSNIANFSDDGVTFHGAYGHRWRNHFGNEAGVIDQLITIIHALHKNPDDRRIVLQMWDPMEDLGMEGKDFPCNVTATFRIHNGNLDMTVFNRSNDMIWGAYGANAVHFSMLQEVVAAFIGCGVGRYWQISTNLHAYDSTYDRHGEALIKKSAGFSEYELGEISPYPMISTTMDRWFSELDMFLVEGHSAIGYVDPFFKKVAVPMSAAWEAWKNRQNPMYYEITMEHLSGIVATDWRRACEEWIDRRYKKHV